MLIEAVIWLIVVSGKSRFPTTPHSISIAARSRSNVALCMRFGSNPSQDASLIKLRHCVVCFASKAERIFRGVSVVIKPSMSVT